MYFELELKEKKKKNWGSKEGVARKYWRSSDLNSWTPFRGWKVPVVFPTEPLHIIRCTRIPPLSVPSLEPQILNYGPSCYARQSFHISNPQLLSILKWTKLLKFILVLAEMVRNEGGCNILQLWKRFVGNMIKHARFVSWIRSCRGLRACWEVTASGGRKRKKRCWQLSHASTSSTSNEPSDVLHLIRLIILC